MFYKFLDSSVVVFLNFFIYLGVGLSFTFKSWKSMYWTYRCSLVNNTKLFSRKYLIYYKMVQNLQKYVQDKSPGVLGWVQNVKFWYPWSSKDGLKAMEERFTTIRHRLRHFANLNNKTVTNTSKQSHQPKIYYIQRCSLEAYLQFKLSFSIYKKG